MEEKILIKSKRGNITKIVCLGIIILGIIVFTAVWVSQTSYGFYYERIVDGDWNYVFNVSSTGKRVKKAEVRDAAEKSRGKAWKEEKSRQQAQKQH